MEFLRANIIKADIHCNIKVVHGLDSPTCYVNVVIIRSKTRSFLELSNFVESCEATVMGTRDIFGNF